LLAAEDTVRIAPGLPTAWAALRWLLRWNCRWPVVRKNKLHSGHLKGLSPRKEKAVNLNYLKQWISRLACVNSHVDSKRVPAWVKAVAKLTQHSFVTIGRMSTRMSRQSGFERETFITYPRKRKDVSPCEFSYDEQEPIVF
jgi:hypothetical protein